MTESSNPQRQAPAPAEVTPAPARRLPQIEDFPEGGPNALATFGQRGWARVADELIVSIPLWFLVAAVTVALYGSPEAVPADTHLPLLMAGAAFIVQVLYEVIAVALWGRTLGKWLTGIRVARYTDGQCPTWSQSALRCLLWAAPGAGGLVLTRFSAVGALPVFLSAWRGDDLRRGWHDDAGGTIVVRSR
jgi:uncharacterized RDD family membrane protein YckC